MPLIKPIRWWKNKEKDDKGKGDQNRRFCEAIN